MLGLLITPDHRSNANVCWSNYGCTVGRYDKALPLSEEAVLLTRRVLGPAEEEAAHAIGSLAAVWHLMGHHERALPLHEEALVIRERLLGPSHLDTMNSMHGLGQCLVALGEHQSGLAKLEGVANRAQRVLGATHPSTEHFKKGLEDARVGNRDAQRKRRGVTVRV